MCTLLFAIDSHAKYDFLLLGNRDEFLKRETQTAHWWQTQPAIFAGKDLVAGGTWMGISETGKIAALTNYRDPQTIRADALSRGDLVKDFLEGELAAADYLAQIQPKANLYNDFNLLIGSGKEFYYFSNRSPVPIRPLPPGIYGLSNALLDTPWRKVTDNKNRFRKLLQSNDFEIEKGFELLKNPDTYADELLPSTGVPLEMERALSALFIQLPQYGTRISTFIATDKKGGMFMEERSYYNAGAYEMEMPQVNRAQFSRTV